MPCIGRHPDILEAEIPLTAEDAVLATVDVPEVGRATLGPVCLPYCVEYRPREAGEGLENLRNLAEATGGAARDELEGIWESMPERPKYFALAPWLALAAMIFILAETLQRRTGLLTAPLAIFKIRRQTTDFDSRKKTKKQKTRTRSKLLQQTEAKPQSSGDIKPPVEKAPPKSNEQPPAAG